MPQCSLCLCGLLTCLITFVIGNLYWANIRISVPQSERILDRQILQCTVGGALIFWAATWQSFQGPHLIFSWQLLCCRSPKQKGTRSRPIGVLVISFLALGFLDLALLPQFTIMYLYISWLKLMLFMFQLPRMLETDAVARYYGLSKGTVVKFTYDNELTANHVSYRCVLWLMQHCFSGSRLM
jgi:hypothetical protein